jgi:hypothetical protein
MTRILSAVEHYPDQSGRMGRDNGIGLRTFILALRYTRMRNGDVKSLSVPGFVAGALNTPRLKREVLFLDRDSTLHTAIGTWQRSLRNLFKQAKVFQWLCASFSRYISVELLLAGISIEEVSILLGHSNIRITQQRYSPSPSVRDRQLHLQGLKTRLCKRKERCLAGYVDRVRV